VASGGWTGAPPPPEAPRTQPTTTTTTTTTSESRAAGRPTDRSDRSDRSPMSAGGPSAAIDPDTQIAMEALDAIDTFAIGRVGFAGTPNQGETLTLELAQRPDAVEAFAWMAERGSPVARLYAYWALRTLAPSRAAIYAAALAKDTDPVEIASGCILSTSTVGVLADRMQNPSELVGQAMPLP
jgi:hypothetical protein